MKMRRLCQCYLVASAFWALSGGGGTTTPVAPDQAVGPASDPAGEAFSKPSKPAGSPVGK